MKQWMVLFQKEWLEMLRNYKLIWLPLVFILFGVLKPVTSYYMPQILESLGELPEGTVIEMPVPSSEEVLVATLADYSQLGILILVLAFMGVIATERRSGVASLILVKPVSFVSFITAKWTAMLILTWISLALGLVASWYYTYVLIGTVEWQHLLFSYFTYGLWLAFVITLTLFYSSLLKSTGVIAFLSIFSIIGLSVITGIFSQWMEWSPGQLSSHAHFILLVGEAREYLLLSSIVTILAIILLQVLSSYFLRRKEFED